MVWDELGWRDEDKREGALRRLRARLAAQPEPSERALTAFELRVTVCLSHGLGDQGTADVLGVTIETVKTHSVHARQKLRARNTTHLVALALRHELIR